MRRNRQQKPAEGTNGLGEPSGVCLQGLPLRVSLLDIDVAPHPHPRLACTVSPQLGTTPSSCSPGSRMAPSHNLQRAPSPPAWGPEQAYRQGVCLEVGGGGRHRGVSALGEPGLTFDYLRSALAVESCVPILGNKSFSELEKQAHLFPVTHRHTFMNPHTHRHTHTHTHREPCLPLLISAFT